MSENEILDFKQMITKCSLDELYDMQHKINQEINKMMLNTDLVMKAAAIDLMIRERKVKE